MKTKSHQYALLTFPERLETGQRFLPYAFLLSVTFALYGPTLYFSFQWDDYLYVVNNPLVRELSLPYLRAIWSGSYVGHYAPVHLTFLSVIYRFAGLNPFAFHLAQLFLHAGCVCILYFVLRRVESPRVAFLSSLLFALHPTNVETVAWISEAKSTLAFLFFLLSFLVFVRVYSSSRWWLPILCVALLAASLLAKINTIVAPAIFLLYSYRQRGPVRRPVAGTLIAVFLTSAIFLMVHLWSFFWSGNSLAKDTLEGSYYSGLGVHLLNLPFFIFFYLRMVFFPYPLTPWHMVQVHESLDWAVGAAWVLLLAAAWLVYRSGRNTQFWSLWFVVFLLPVLQIVPNLTWVAERYLYIPAIGAFVLLVRLASAIWGRLPSLSLRRGLESAVALLLLVCFLRTQSYLPAFRNELTLWEHALPTCPTSAQCHAGLGQALLNEGQIARGIQELIRAVEIRPSAVYLEKLGDGFTIGARDYRQAAVAYQMALEQASLSPSAGNLYTKLARALVLGGRLVEADKAIQASGKISPHDPFLLMVTSFYEWKMGNLAKAADALRRSLAVAGQDSSIPRFVSYYWSSADEVGRFLQDLGPQLREARPASAPRPAQLRRYGQTV